MAINVIYIWRSSASGPVSQLSNITVAFHLQLHSQFTLIKFISNSFIIRMGNCSNSINKSPLLFESFLYVVYIQSKKSLFLFRLFLYVFSTEPEPVTF